MSSDQSNDLPLPPPIRSAICPGCNKPMRLESASPDIRATNVMHFLFKCDCGRDSDKLVGMDALARGAQ